MPRKGEVGAERFEGLQQGQFYSPGNYGDEEFGQDIGSGSASIAYNNLHYGQGSPDEDHLWFVSEYTGGSDYSGTTAEKSNYNVILEEAERLAEEMNDETWFQTFHGAHGTYAIAFHVEKTPAEIVEMLEGLENYPVLDESAMSELEVEEEGEAWEATYRDDYRRALEKVFDGDAEGVDDDELFKHFMEWSDKANEYWEHSTEGPYIDVDRIAKKAGEEEEPPEGMQMFYEVEYLVSGAQGPVKHEKVWIKAGSGPESEKRFYELLDAGDPRIWGDIEGAQVEHDGKDRFVKYGTAEQRTIGGEWEPAAVKLIRLGEIWDVGEGGVEDESRLVEDELTSNASTYTRKLSGGTAIDLERRRFGWTAWLVGTSGKSRLPISIPRGNQDMPAAFDQALQSLNRSRRKQSLAAVRFVSEPMRRAVAN